MAGTGNPFFRNIGVCVVKLLFLFIVYVPPAQAAAGDTCHLTNCSGTALKDASNVCRCWFTGAAGESCDTVCTGEGGCVASDWNDSTGCGVLIALLGAGGSCLQSAQAFAPATAAGNKYYRSGATSQDCASSNGAAARICACDEGAVMGSVIIISANKQTIEHDFAVVGLNKTTVSSMPASLHHNMSVALIMSRIRGFSRRTYSPFSKSEETK